MKALARPVPAWHAEARQILAEHFDRIHACFLDAVNRAVWLGLFLNYVKERGRLDGSIPHGEFGPWLARELPGLSWNHANRYMKIARGVAEKGKFEIRHFAEFAGEAKLSFLQVLTADHLPPQLREIKERIDALIAGKTQSQLLLEFRQLDADGEPLPGRRPGEGGRRRLSLAEQAAQATADAVEDWRHLERALLGYRERFTYLSDEEVVCQEAVLEAALKARRTWLKAPKNRRCIADIAELFHP